MLLPTKPKYNFVPKYFLMVLIYPQIHNKPENRYDQNDHLNRMKHERNDHLNVFQIYHVYHSILEIYDLY